MTTAIAASFVAARSSLPFAIAAPDGATAALTATLAAKVAQRLIEMGPPDDLLAPVMIVLALATLLTGILLFSLASREREARSASSPTRLLGDS